MRYAQLASRARRIKYFLHIYVHAASSDALARMRLIVIADNTRNDYVAEGTSLKTGDFESSWIQHTSGAVCMVIEDSFNL